MPAGCIFTVRSYAIVDEERNLLALLAVLASSLVDYVAKLLLGRFGFPEFVVGSLQKIPVPDLSIEDTTKLGLMARRAWSLERTLSTRIEISPAFALPALLQVEGDVLASCADAWAAHVESIGAELAAIQAGIDALCFDLYDVNELDRRAITQGFGRSTDESNDSGDHGDADTELDSDIDDVDDVGSRADVASLAAELTSWAVGVAFGRFDVRFAKGGRKRPTEPEPFQRLPWSSPGILTNDDGLPFKGIPCDYPLRFPESGLLVDDPGDPRDLTRAVRAVFDVIFGARADAWWNQAAALLDPKGHNLRAWLALDFFEHHLKRYSKSGRKAPILWQLATASGRYSIWLYAHRLTPDSFFQLQNDVWSAPLGVDSFRRQV
jgi:hypothetical protein